MMDRLILQPRVSTPLHAFFPRAGIILLNSISPPCILGVAPEQSEVIETQFES
jgi:hypothetical protein